jgi:hypothetical protein
VKATAAGGYGEWHHRFPLNHPRADIFGPLRGAKPVDDNEIV